jgi:hypothetical protein
VVVVVGGWRSSGASPQFVLLGARSTRPPATQSQDLTTHSRRQSELVLPADFYPDRHQPGTRVCCTVPTGTTRRAIRRTNIAMIAEPPI